MKILVRGALVLLGLLMSGRAALAEAPVPAFRTEDVRYRNGEIELAALLLLPSSEGRVPAAVIIQGSGASDRNNRWARRIAEELVHNGVAVLLTDKRGSGASKGSWQTSGFDDLAADALAGVELLRARPEIDPDRVKSRTPSKSVAVGVFPRPKTLTPGPSPTALPPGRGEPNPLAFRFGVAGVLRELRAGIRLEARKLRASVDLEGVAASHFARLVEIV